MSENEKASDRLLDRHLDEVTLLLYAERQLDRDQAQEVSLHTQTCSRCLTLLRVLDRESRLLTRSLLEEDEPLPARLAEFRGAVKRSMEWIWGAVFGLSVLAVYALYTVYIEPWQQSLEIAGFGGSNLLSLLFFQGAFWKGWQSMFTLLEVLVFMTGMGFAVFAFRRYLKRGSALAVVMASIGLLAAVAPPASATECRRGDTVQVAKDETVKSDLILNGRNMRVDGTVDGDVFVFGQQVEVSGHVTGDLILFAQSARMSGMVDGNIRSFTNNITITGTVGRSVTAFNETLELDTGGKVGGSMIVFTKALTLDGKLSRDLLAFAAFTTLSGTIDGNVKVKGDSLTVSSSAVLGGKNLFEADKPAEVSPEAKLASPMEFKKIEHKSQIERGGSYYFWKLVWTVALALLGLALLSLAPEFGKEAVRWGERGGASLGLGVLVFFGVLIGACIACVTIVGFFVGLSTLCLWLVSLWASYAIVGTVLGQWILGRSEEFWPMAGRMALGLLLVRVATAIPHLGFWAMLVVWFWGMGAIALAIYRRVQPVIAPNIPPLPPATTVAA